MRLPWSSVPRPASTRASSPTNEQNNRNQSWPARAHITSFGACYMYWFLNRLTDLFILSELTVEKLAAFIPDLLARLHVECFFHGNLTKEVGACCSEIAVIYVRF